jgi:glucose-1-phosphate thymidylyltransferase
LKVIIPVAGIGSRLRPHTYSTSKVLLHVAGRPILSHVLEPVIKLNPEEIIFVIGFKGEDVKQYIQSTYSFKSRFVLQEQLLGLGYALDLALREMADGPVLILLGDTIVEIDLEKFVTAGENVLALKTVDDPHRFGIAEVKDGYVAGLEEKPAEPKTNLAIVGLYYFRNSQELRSTLGAHVKSGKTTRGEIQFTDALQTMIQHGTKFVPFEAGEWLDCGKKETLLSTNRHLLSTRQQTARLEGSVIIPPVFVAEGATVKHSVIGPYVSISEGALVESSVVSDTIIGPHAQVSHAVLDESLVGHHVTIRGQAKQVNVGDSSEIATN